MDAGSETTKRKSAKLESAKSRINYEFWRRPDHPQVAGRDRKDEAEREDGPPGSEPLERGSGGRGYYHGPGAGSRETECGPWGWARGEGTCRPRLGSGPFVQRRVQCRDA